jgi:hypothetical protein
MRLNELRGVANLLREAYLQLPGPATLPAERDPYEVMGVRPDTPLADIEAMYRIVARRIHPDRGGSEAAMKEVNHAWEVIQAEREKKGDSR